jgi:hypothetical protein
MGIPLDKHGCRSLVRCLEAWRWMAAPRSRAVPRALVAFTLTLAGAGGLRADERSIWKLGRVDHASLEFTDQWDI